MKANIFTRSCLPVGGAGVYTDRLRLLYCKILPGRVSPFLFLNLFFLAHTSIESRTMISGRLGLLCVAHLVGVTMGACSCPFDFVSCVGAADEAGAVNSQRPKAGNREVAGRHRVQAAAVMKDS